MRNKGFFWGITIALSLACIYQLSFTFATSGVEKEAESFADDKLDSLSGANALTYQIGKDTFDLTDSAQSENLSIIFQQEYIRSKRNEDVHFAGYTYAECKESEINLGLDLKGGMSATLEISVPELVWELAGKTRNQMFNVPFEEAKTRTNAGEGDFIDLFVEEFEIANPDQPMAKIFHMHNVEDVAADASNEEVAEFLKEQAVNALDGIETIIEKRVNTFGVAQPTIQKQPGSNRIFVELPGVSDKETVRRRLQATANLEFYEVYNNAQFGIGNYLLAGEQKLAKELFGEDAGLDPLEEPVAEEDSTSTDENTIETDSTSADSTNLLDDFLSDADSLGDDDLLGDLDEDEEVVDSTKTREELERERPISALFQILFQYDENQTPIGFNNGSAVGYASVTDTATLNFRINHPTVRAEFPAELKDLKFMWDAKELADQDGIPTGIIYLHAIKVPTNGPQVSGKDIDKSYVDNSQIGEFGVTMTMNSIGSKKWGEMTENNVGKQVAITMDGFVYSAPVVNEKMTRSSSITGNFTVEEATELSGLLNAGALPAPVRIVDEAVVGASLGEDNINSGFWSFAFALGLVLLYMIFYYNRAGLVADAALVINIFLLVGALASLKAILTLPGIAGIVLTIGMSVDANVLIFERIREEIRNGKGIKAAISEGYSKALSAILDANVTTLLTGIVLAIFGTGPIKGFATTLIIGIFTSFFAAIVITRLIISYFTDRDKKITFSSKITENWFTKTNVQFVKSRKKFYILSAVIILIGVGSFVMRGLDYGVDFAGGRQYKVVFTDTQADYEGIKKALTPELGGNEPGVKSVDNSYTALITTKYLIEDPDTSINNKVQGIVETQLAGFGTNEIVESKMIAPTISKDLKANSFYAIGFSLLIIFFYILLRFRKWQYGLGALIAMAHDVLIVLSLFSLFYGWIGFSMEIDQAFIAAILTVVGYSINDTVVVFDRIREYMGIYTKKDRKEVINMALNSTLGRTVNTSVSTFIVLLIIFVFGGAAIQGFVFALMIGVIVGTYSSLFIATPTVIDFTRSENESK